MLQGFPRMFEQREHIPRLEIMLDLVTDLDAHRVHACHNPEADGSPLRAGNLNAGQPFIRKSAENRRGGEGGGRTRART